jgi:hypothetical protein
VLGSAGRRRIALDHHGSARRVELERHAGAPLRKQHHRARVRLDPAAVHRLLDIGTQARLAKGMGTPGSQPGSLASCMSQLMMRSAACGMLAVRRQQPVHQHAATFQAEVEAAARADLPQFVKDAFDAFFECGILALGLLRPRRWPRPRQARRLLLQAARLLPVVRAALGAWRRRRPAWWTTSSPPARPPCWRCRSRCDCCWMHDPSW